MNLFFWLLIIIGLILLWFVLSFVFFPLGKLAHRLYKDAMDEINRKDEEEKKENER